MRRALGFLTPFGGSSMPTPGALPWFPVVGALIGAAVGATWWGAASIWPLPVAAALTVAADLALTGMLHLDGLADSADALLPPVSRERRLEIMRDPRSGAFGVAAVVVVLLLRFSVFASVAPAGQNVLAVAGIWAMSRAAMAVTACAVPYARAQGLATVFLGASPWVTAVIAVPLALGLGAAGTDPHLRGVLAVAGCAVTAAAVVAFAEARLGGFTGDVLGACGVLGETAALLILAVHV
jgi:adenosylcobinamide-GDP ribazoletransferase